jgi:hypothetical protein
MNGRQKLILFFLLVAFLPYPVAFASGQKSIESVFSQPDRSVKVKKKGGNLRKVEKKDKNRKLPFGVMISPTFFLFNPLFTYFVTPQADSLCPDTLELLNKHSIKPSVSRILHS